MDASMRQRVEEILVAGAGKQWDGRVIDAFLRCRQAIFAIRQRGLGGSLRQALDGALHKNDLASVGVPKMRTSMYLRPSGSAPSAMLLLIPVAALIVQPPGRVPGVPAIAPAKSEFWTLLSPGVEDAWSAVRPKMKMFSMPTRSAISTLAPSSVPTVSAPFSANFMLPVPEASIPAVEICSDTSEAGMTISARLTE